MKEIDGKKLTGERAEYFKEDVHYNNTVFVDGESPLKHGKNVLIENSSFEYKYPLWNTENATVKKSTFLELGKSGLWYTKNTTIEDTVIEAPKEFRRCTGVTLKNVEFKNAAETLWTCNDVELFNVKANGDYFAMNSQNFKADKLFLDGNYFIDGGKNIEIRNSVLNSKDSFWNCENVTVYDSEIIGEYIGWNSKNLKFVNCTIESNQGFCYIDGLVLENCVLKNTDLAFEYCTNLDVIVKGKIESVKNPCGGKITADEIDTLILNASRCDVNATKINCSRIGKTLTEDPNPNER